MWERDYKEGEPPGQPLDSFAFVDEGCGSKTHILPSSQWARNPPMLGELNHSTWIWEQTFPNKPGIKMLLLSIRTVHCIQQKILKCRLSNSRRWGQKGKLCHSVGGQQRFPFRTFTQGWLWAEVMLEVSSKPSRTFWYEWILCWEPKPKQSLVQIKCCGSCSLDKTFTEMICRWGVVGGVRVHPPAWSLQPPHQHSVWVEKMHRKRRKPFHFVAWDSWVCIYCRALTYSLFSWFALCPVSAPLCPVWDGDQGSLCHLTALARGRSSGLTLT